MTYPKLKSDAAAPGSPVVDYPYLRPSLTDPLVPANDDEGPRKWYQIRNPLWVIVVAMAFLFTVMALFVALG
jgi:hypothetical protein